MPSDDFTAWCREHDWDVLTPGLRERFETFDWYHGAARWDFPPSGYHYAAREYV